MYYILTTLPLVRTFHVDARDKMKLTKNIARLVQENPVDPIVAYLRQKGTPSTTVDFIYVFPPDDYRRWDTR